MFRSFQPFLNPIGFGASDFIELYLIAPLVLFFILRPYIQPHIGALAARTGWCMLLFAALPVALRLGLLSHHPVPTPDLYDEFTHLLVADTLSHFRLANPTHPFHSFFETFFVLQQPSYSAIYPIGQGVALALGRALSGYAWAGVLLSVAALCSLCYWMLRGWTSPPWAFAGGVLAVCLFGPLNSWTNTYWGGAVSGVAGCLVFGALPRIIERARLRDALLLGLGLGIQLLTRPYESIFLIVAIALFLFTNGRAVIRLIPAIVLISVAALGVTLLHNKQVTGSWTTLPEMASQYQYGVPTTFTFQPNPVPHRPLTPQQELSYKQQVSFHGDHTETVRSYLLRLQYRARYLRFYLPAAVYLVLPLLLFRLREKRALWATVTLAIFALGANFYPFFFPHYIAAIACLLVLAAVTALRQLSRISERAAIIVAWLCVAPFAFWFGIHLFESPKLPLPALRFETGDVLNHRNPERRIMVRRQLDQVPGKQLVFVRYSPRHIFQDEWVYNEAAIDDARVVWARDSGPAENEKLRLYYPDRTAWLLEPDVVPPALNAYRPEPPAAPPVPAPEPPKHPEKPVLRFEEVK